MTPARAPLGELGAAFVDLAASPLGEAPNPVPGRLLTPLVSWSLGLRGEGVLVTVLAVCLLLPVLVALGFWLGSLLEVPLSRLHPTVRLAERCRQAAAQIPFEIGDRTIDPTVTFGVAGAAGATIAGAAAIG